ncbi:MAG: CHAP domain-containing protein [Bacteroidota bacterium]
MNPNKPIKSLASLALQIAQSQVGQAETPKGSNTGPMVNEYLKAAGLKPGYPWCQAFVYWCYAEAAKCMKSNARVVRTASVSECWKKATGKKLSKMEALQNPTQLRPGDQFILLFDNGTGHTGIVESIVATNAGVVLHTIEGNSNTTGHREGYAVVKHTRRIGDKALAGFIQYQ